MPRNCATTPLNELVRVASIVRLRLKWLFLAYSISTRAGTSVATRSWPPPRTGAPLVAATTVGDVSDVGPEASMTMRVNDAVERSRIWPSIAWPTSVCMNASPSWTPYGSRCRLPSAGTGPPLLGKSVRAVASTPASPACCRDGSESRALTVRTPEVAVSVVGLAPLASSESSTGPSAGAHATRPSSCAPPGSLRTRTSAFCSSSRIAA